VEIARGRSGSWLYDVNRHLNLCASLREEYEALAEYFAEGARDASEAVEADAKRPLVTPATSPKRRARKGSVQA